MKVFVIVGRELVGCNVVVRAVCSTMELAQEWIKRTYKSDTPVEYLPSIETWIVDHFVH